MRIAWLLLIAACGTSSTSSDVVGPFTGDVHTYYVDGFTLPRTTTEARSFGDDLNGDGTVDNQLGLITSTLAGLGANDLTTYAPDMIAAGVLRSTFEIQADDLQADPTAGVRYIGAPGDPATVVGGSIDAGTFVSNRTATAKHLGTATMHLPIFEDVDPVVLELEAMELDLVPDTTGYVARVHGLVGSGVSEAAATGIADMIAANPADHRGLVEILDQQHTGKLDAQSLETNSVLTALLEPDVTRDGKHYVSFGFVLHLSATAPQGPPSDLCHDRVHDGDESGIDCGGSCLPCAGGATCSAPGDCQSQSCAGTCAVVSCTDHVADGLETDVDCGGWECSACGSGLACLADADCTSGHCMPGLHCQ